MPNSTRLGLPYPTLSSVDDVPADILALVNSLDSRTVIFSSGTLPARPAPATAGRFYLQTDVTPNYLWIDTGTAWVGIGPSASFAIADNSITNAKLVDATIQTGKIGDGQITGAKIADGTVTAAELANALKPSAGAGAAVEALRALGTAAGTAAAGNDPRFASIGSGAPSGPAGGDLGAPGSQYPNPVIKDKAVTTQKIDDGAVTSTQLAGAVGVTAAVSTAKIQDDAITQPKMATGSVGTDEIIDGSVTKTEIGGGAVIAAKLSDAASADGPSVIDAKIADDSITGTKIKAATLPGSKLTDNSVTGPKLVDDAVTQAKIADNAVGNAQMADQAIGATEIADALKPSVAAAAGTEALRALGTGAANAAAGNDARFSKAVSPRGTSFPTSGQIIGEIYTWVVGGGVTWQMQWTGTLWEFVGGTPFVTIRDDLDVISAGTTWTNSPADLFLNVPFSGDYLVEISASILIHLNGGVHIGLQVNGIAPDETYPGPFGYAEFNMDASGPFAQMDLRTHIRHTMRINGLLANQTLRFQSRSLDTQQYECGHKVLRVQPIRSA